MTAQQVDHPSRYDVPDHWSLPDVAAVFRSDDVAAVAGVEESMSEYFDTAARDLSGFGATLLLCTGPSDPGWELTLPNGTEPALHRAPLGSDAAVPEELGQLVSGIARGGALIRFAIVRSERTTHRWTDETGAVIVEIDETLHTSASTPGAGQLDTWRELTLEHGPASRPKLARRLGKALIAGGATPATASIGSRATRVLDAPSSRPRRKAKSGKKNLADASDAITFLAAQDATLITEDVRLRTGQEDVHAVRVATRRARSTLKIFADLFDPTVATRFSGELGWYAALLGEVRDRQVQRERFAAALAELPDELVLGPIAATIEQHLLSEQLRAAATLREAMAGDRYRELLRTSSEFVRDPPLAPSTRARVRARVTSSSVERAGRKAHRRLDRALSAGDDELLHEARKAAKRARYAAELSLGQGGRNRAAVKEFKQLQEILGEYQDSVVASALLRQLGAATHADPTQNGFTFGILHEQEAQRAERARAAAMRWRRRH
ncbi:MAG: CYTH and CHAD domain-containing protein [Nakamurella sp.]